MSESIRRRSSSKQLLQNLIRVTAQRSQEDAEEVERERRRRAKERQRGEPHQHNAGLTQSTDSNEELKPSCLVMEEDEGFSDWSHRLENRNEHEVQDRAKEPKCSGPPGPEQNRQQEEEVCGRRSSVETSTQRPEKTSSTQNTGRTSYSSSVFVSQDTRLQHAAGHPADRTSYLAAGTMKPRCLLQGFDQFSDLHHSGGACRMDEEEGQKMQEEEEEEEEGEGGNEEMKPSLQRETAGTPLSSGDEDQEEEELNFTHEEKEDLNHRKEERSEGGEEGQEDDQCKRSAERRRSEEVNSRSSGSLFSSSEGEESLNCYGPMSPTFKKLLIQFYPEEANSRISADGKCTITERTESLRRSSSSIKKTPPPLSVTKIDKRLEQYAQALEVSSKEGRSVCQGPPDLLGPAEPVASKKNLFEAGEAWTQSATSTPSKEADGLKVGVADLINQWVKGSEDGSGSSSPSKPAEIRPGGVSNRKNLWESFGDTVSPTRDGKENSTKRYKFVVAGHGKYTKVSSDNGCREEVNHLAAGQMYEDL